MLKKLTYLFLLIALFSCEKKEGNALDKKTQEFLIHQHNTKVTLPKNWIFLSNREFADSLSFVNLKNTESGVLQLSITKYKSGSVPNPTFKDLSNLVKKQADNAGLYNIKYQDYGKCNFGIYGRIDYSNNEIPFFSIWQLTNGKDFIMATYINYSEFNPVECGVISNIIKSISENKTNNFI